MSFHSFLPSRQSARSHGRRSQPARRSTRLVLEQLEHRALPSTYTANTAADLINDINAANAAGGANTITLAAPTTSPYVLTAVDNSTNGATGLPVIAANDNLTIVGNGDTIERSTLSTTPDFRLLAVESGGSLTLQNLTLQGGYDDTGIGGGGIFNAGTLVLNGVTVQHNSALVFGGGISSLNGPVTLEGGSIIQNNAAIGAAGSGNTHDAGTGSPGEGGGLYALLGPEGALTLNNATVDNNKAGFGGGLYVWGGANGGTIAVGAPVSLSNDTVTSNTSDSGGGLYVDGASVTLSYDIVTSNSALGGIGGAGGGGLFVQSGNVTLANDTVASNSTGRFGGGMNVEGGAVTVSYDTFESNSALYYGGGGLYVGSGSVTLANDTLESNTATKGTNDDGGGLYVWGGAVTLSNDTVESNSASHYGGIYIHGGRVAIDSFTITNTINNTDSSGLNGSTANIDGTYTPDYVQTETSISVSPASASLDWGVTQQFTAAALDQFGEPMAPQPAVTWTVAAGGAGGSVSAGGLYTAPFGNGTDTVVATDAGINLSGTATVTVTLTPPIVTVSAAANPTPVTGTTTNLTVTGSDPGDPSLMYTWAVTGAPAGAATPTFSSNGSTAAQNTTATFYLAGTYTFQAAISDPDNQTAVSSVSVIVSQTATAISVSPGNVTLAVHGQQQFTAALLDQFGQTMGTPAGGFTWSVASGGIGAISSKGLYTAPSSGTGLATIQASADGLIGTATVTIQPFPPVITKAASATLNPTSTQVQLQVQASDPQGSKLSYAWAVTSQPNGAKTPTFSNAGSNQSTATFYQAGSYTFAVTITDAAGLSTTSSVTVNVAQTLTSISLTPANVTLAEGATQQFAATALDQFGEALVSLPAFTWQVTGVGTISNTGLYTAPTTQTGKAQVKVSAGGKSAQANVTVVA